MNITLLKQFNNYFNRKIIIYSSYSDYITNYTYEPFGNIDFEPADGINATQIINWDEDWSPDYFLCTDANNAIVSRWFVIEWSRVRGKQYRATLRRDVVADNLNVIKQNPCFVEKGIITNENDPLIYNNEGMTFNQIKQSETLLKDTTGVQWIVGYLPQDEASYPSSGSINANVDINISGAVDWYEIFPDLVPDVVNGNNFRIFKDQSYKIDHMSYWSYCLGRDPSTLFITQARQKIVTLNSNGYTTLNDKKIIDPVGWQCIIQSSDYYTYLSELPTAADYLNNRTLIVNGLIQHFNFEQYEYDDFSNLPAIVKINDKFYRVLVERKSGTELYLKRRDYNSVLYERINNFLSLNITGTHTSLNMPTTPDESDKNVVQFNTNYYDVNISFKEINLSSVSFTIPGTRRHNNDEPFDFFCLPAQDFGIGSILTNGELNKSIAKAIATKLTTAACYDLQLLPYCPIENPSSLDDKSANIDFLEIKDATETPRAYIFFGANSSFTKDINVNINIPQRNDNAALNKKLSNECDLFRLCSPNYNGVFEFSVAKNNGVVGFNVDCTYKPHNPYIHVNPAFKNLYGNDFDDVRGLICGGDFSLTTVGDAFAAYEIQNKNYQAIFDRQIQNLDINNSIAKMQAIAQTIAGTATAGGAGAAAGAMVGGPVGAAIGGAVGGAASLGGGIADLALLKKQQEETRSFAIDNYGYQLGNIKALPESLSKTSSINRNNKMFPFIEYYTCTDTEVEALTNKLQWDGWTVMKIDTLENYSGYIKGRLIRLDGIEDDNHMAEEIYNEISKGVYL